MIDRDGYRPNVGIILCNARNQVFWGKRIREHSWQFPQGGIKQGESPEEAARNARYQALEQLLESNDVLLVAQHQEDQLETVLLQLFRGAGVQGLAAIPDVIQ